MQWVSRTRKENSCRPEGMRRTVMLVNFAHNYIGRVRDCGVL